MPCVLQHLSGQDYLQAGLLHRKEVEKKASFLFSHIGSCNVHDPHVQAAEDSDRERL